MGAIISPCGTYRYVLERTAAPQLVYADNPRTMAVIMVNPSTADAVSDDATIRKVMGFAARAGCEHVLVGNKFAYRSKDIKALRTAPDPIGPDNDAHIESILVAADLHVVAWGPLGKLPRHLRDRWRDIVAIADRVGARLHAIAVAADGQPCHPLMLPYESKLSRWAPPSRPTMTEATASVATSGDA